MARGKVLEVGIGTGLNLPHYDPSRVEKIWGLDPDTELQPLARRRIGEHGLEVELLGLSGEEIPMDDDSFDSVVVTFTLCTIPDVAQALLEMRRVLKPDGRLLFCEHGLAPEARVAGWQRRLTPGWKRLAGGCHLDRDMPALLDAAGFCCEQLDDGHLPGLTPLLKPFTYIYRGAARIAGPLPQRS